MADAGRTRAAAGNLVANFLLLKSDGAISGFAKNGDAIVIIFGLNAIFDNIIGIAIWTVHFKYAKV